MLPGSDFNLKLVLQVISEVWDPEGVFGETLQVVQNTVDISFVIRSIYIVLSIRWVSAILS